MDHPCRRGSSRLGLEDSRGLDARANEALHLREDEDEEERNRRGVTDWKKKIAGRSKPWTKNIDYRMQMTVRRVGNYMQSDHVLLIVHQCLNDLNRVGAGKQITQRNKWYRKL